MKAAVLTLGCKVNQAESSSIEGALKQGGWEIVDLKGRPEFCIVNTCSVTSKSDLPVKAVDKTGQEAWGKGYRHRLLFCAEQGDGPFDGGGLGGGG